MTPSPRESAAAFTIFACLTVLGSPAAWAAAEAASRPSCEPSGEVELHARILSQSLLSGGAEVRVELVLISLMDLRSARLSLAGAESGEVDASDLPAELGPRASGIRHKIGSTLKISSGRTREILFVIEGEDLAGVVRSASSQIRVELDPARLPVARGDVIEYRARAQGN